MTRRKPDLPRTSFRVEADALVVDLGALRPILSSAPRGGGLLRARYVLNHQVPANPVATPVSGARRRWGDPARALGAVARRLGLDGHCVALMTAVPLKQLVVQREEQHGLWVEGFITVGVSNAVRAGEPVPRAAGTRGDGSAGTINVILVTNARLSASAMVGAVQVATEAKTSALLDHGVPSWTGQRGATGTGTDTVVVCCGDGPRLRYSGTHTQVGSMIGRVVLHGVQEGLRRSDRWLQPVSRHVEPTKCSSPESRKPKRR